MNAKDGGIGSRKNREIEVYFFDSLWYAIPNWEKEKIKNKIGKLWNLLNIVLIRVYCFSCVILIFDKYIKKYDLKTQIKKSIEIDNMIMNN